MKSSELSACIKQFPSLHLFFNGIYAKDNIPKKLKNYNFIIVNTDRKDGPGIHWYCLLKINDCIECFDSLGIDQEKKFFLFSLPLMDTASECEINSTPLQSSNSSSCGEFVLYFLINRYHNLDISYNELLNDLFDVSSEINETNVKKFLLDNCENFIQDG